ncbi:hypothetical protein [Streptomyces qinglanensis]|uniref:hypothetical protein n=1 Tax=Streptomyces qinglanensis TaxID=943816 RepID=UPI003D706684
MSIAAAITQHAESVIAAERAARTRLADKLNGTETLTGRHFGEVMAAAANAAAWKELLTLAERKGSMRKAVELRRRQATRVLIEHRDSQSTSALTNEGERLEREGLRSFLSYTEYTVEDLDKEAATAARP